MELRNALPTAVALGALLGVAIVSADPPGDGVPSTRARAIAAVHILAESPVEWDLPVVVNSPVQRFVTLFRDQQPDRMALYLKRSGRYEGMIRAKLRERGMPEDLVYLSMIESGFLPSARSRAGAVGLWQLMGEIARDYGLRVDGYVDERRDPERSTDAALRYLADLHRHFGSWNLAAAAYNSGENRVARVMREETGSERGDDADFWRIRSRLPAETREYVPLIFAAALIGKEPDKYGLDDVERWLPARTDTVRVPGGIDLSVVAAAAGTTETQLKRLNPQLIRSMTPPGEGYAVRVPAGSARGFAGRFPGVQVEARKRAAEEERLATAKEKQAAAEKLAASRHRVQRGETLSGIARKHGVTVLALEKANGLGKRSVLQPGQMLRLPSR
jgi:membrane-bound lytic murein transglycosylase D